DPRRPGARADRAGRPDVVRAVGDRPAREVVAPNRALKALADGGSRDLHQLTRLELLDGDGVPHLRALVGAEVVVAKLAQGTRGRSVGLLQVADLSLGELRLGDLAEGELDCGVAVTLGVADRGDPAGTRLDHRDR